MVKAGTKAKATAPSRVPVRSVSKAATAEKQPVKRRAATRNRSIVVAVDDPIYKTGKARKTGSLTAGKDAPVSPRTLKMIDSAFKNMKAGKRSAPADLKKYAHFAK